MTADSARGAADAGARGTLGVTTLTPLQALGVRAADCPEATALVDFDGRTWTRAQLLAEADAARSGLSTLGFCAGDRVLFSVRPGARALALALAVHELGGVLVPQDPGVGDELFAARVALLAPRWVLAEGPLLARPGSLASRLLRLLGMRWAPLGSIFGARYVRVGRGVPGGRAAIAYDELIARGRDALRREPTSSAAMRDEPTHFEPAQRVHQSLPEDAEALLVHTSGTTRAPRIVVHTRRSLAAILDAVARGLALTEADVVYARDLHMLLPALAAGALAVVPSAGSGHPRQILRTLHRWRVTQAFLVTRDCRALAEQVERDAGALPTSLKQLMIGAAPVRSAFLSRLQRVLPSDCVAWCVYGATEALPIARVSLAEKLAWQGDGDLVGAPIPGVIVRIREDGQLAVSGERCCRGYLGEPEQAEIATGDIATMEDGRIVLLGRAKDMIIRGEHNIYPELYEPAVERIAGVRRAAMVGDFDSRLADERVLLVVEPEPDASEPELRRRIATTLASREGRIDAAAQPDEIIFRRLPESGRSGKVDKAGLRRELGLRDPVR